MAKEDLLKRIEFHSGVLGGKATIRGMRLSVEQVLASLAAGISQEELLAEYPGMTKKDIQAALLYSNNYDGYQLSIDEQDAWTDEDIQDLTVTTLNYANNTDETE